MKEFHIAGRIDIALTHFAAVGLAAILDEEDMGVSRAWWHDSTPAHAVVASDLDQTQVGERLREHASAHSEPNSWVQQRITDGPRAGAGLFTARVKAPSIEEWPSYAAARAAARPTAICSGLDEQMQLALGEPAWWRCDANETRPDDGASRWEMKTRNQGQEFLAHRLAPLATALANRDPERIVAGLTGESVVDETGKNAAESRTATGLTRPGPVDTALAWCALWGLHVAPTIQRPDGIGQSPGVWPRLGVHPRSAALPVYSKPISPRVFGDVMASRPFDIACDWINTGNAEVLAARGWLKDHGVRALLRLPILKIGSTSAPERQLLAGTLEVL